MSVVRNSSRRRWLTVAVGVAVLLAAPALLAARPLHTRPVSADTLAARISASAAIAYQGYAVSNGSVGLPSLPQLDDVIALFDGQTSLRIWYAAPHRWRIDAVGASGERDVYQTAAGQTIWDSAQNQLTTIVGNAPVRLPRAADLAPPDLARRLLAAASGSAADRGTAAATHTPLAARRVAGIAAAGLRLTPTDKRTTIGHIDIWADPATGLPLEVQVSRHGTSTPVLISRLLDLRIGAIPTAATTVPTPPPGVGQTTTDNPNVLAALANLGLGPLPRTLAGLPRTDAGSAATGGLGALTGLGAYGTGLAQIVAATVPGRTGYRAFRAARNAGVETETRDGDFAVVSTPLLSVVVARSFRAQRTYFVAGLVDAKLLSRAGAELISFASSPE